MSADINDRIALAIGEQAPELARAWARQMIDDLHLDLSPYPDVEDPQIIHGIAACLRDSRTRMVCTLELMERARQIGEVAEAKGVAAEQILNGYLILDELLWQLANRELARCAGEKADGEFVVPACVSLRRLHEAVMVVVRATTGAYLHRYRERIREDTERMRSFNRMVSHELKNPISTLQGAAALLSDESVAADPEARGRYVAMVRRNTARMSDLVSDLLALTTTERSEAMAPAEPVAFREIFHTVRERLLDDAEEKGVRIEEGSLPKVAVDRAALELVLTNLVANAIRYSDPEKLDRFVRVSAHSLEDGGAWVVAVEDNGFGIPEEARSRVFERFFRAAPERQISGTGLGLSIVKEVVERWGGHVWLESQEGSGTTFFFTLPGSAA
jgi:signal transduction histidine kinase